MLTKKNFLLGALVVVLIVALTALVVWKDANTTPVGEQDQHSMELKNDIEGDHHEGDITAPRKDSPEFNAAQAMREMYSYKPAEEESTREAGKRAARYFTPETREALENPPSDLRKQKQSELWQDWAKSGDEVIAAARPILSSNAGQNRKMVDVEVTQLVLMKQVNDQTPLDPFVATVTLTQAPDGTWLAETWRVKEGAPTS